MTWQPQLARLSVTVGSNSLLFCLTLLLLPLLLLIPLLQVNDRASPAVLSHRPLQPCTPSTGAAAACC
jgi:hypothetical protein